MSAADTLYDTALQALAAQLGDDWPGAVVEQSPAEVEPEVLFGDRAAWPDLDVPAIAIFDGPVTWPEPHNRGPIESVQQAFSEAPADVVAWGRAPDFATLAQVARRTKRGLIESVQRCDVAHPWSSSHFGLEKRSADVKVSRANVGLYFTVRVGIAVLFDE